MVQIYMLWLPILLSTLALMVVSSLTYMVLPHHKSDFGPVPDEEAARGALKGTPPGLYNIPNLPSREALKDPAYQQKMEEGPLVFMTVAPNGAPNMGKATVQWLVYLLVVAATVAYVGSRTLPVGTSFMRVFQVLGTVAWLALGFGMVREAIWYARPWNDIWKHLADTFVFGCVVGLIFAGLWP